MRRKSIKSLSGYLSSNLGIEEHTGGTKHSFSKPSLFTRNVCWVFACNSRHIALAERLDICTELNMHWTFVQCKMLRHFATFSSLVQSCSAMSRAVQSILKAVKNARWIRLNFFCLKKMFSRCHPTEHFPVYASALQMQQWTICWAPAPFYFRRLRFSKESSVITGKKWSHKHQLGFMNSRERYSGSNEDSSDEIHCSSDDSSDRREQEYDNVDGASSRSNRSSTFLLKSMIIDVKILGAELMFPFP